MKITIEFNELDAVALKVLRALASTPPEGLVICCDPPTEVPVTVWAKPEKLEEARANVPLSDEPGVTVATKAIPEAAPVVEIPKPTPKPKKEAPKKEETPTAQTPPPVAPLPDSDALVLQQTLRSLVLRMTDERKLTMADAKAIICKAMGVNELRGVTGDQIRVGIAAAEAFLAETNGAAPADVLDAMFA